MRIRARVDGYRRNDRRQDRFIVILPPGLQRFALMPVKCQQMADLLILYGLLVAFYSQNIIAIIEIEINSTGGEGLPQEEFDAARHQPVVYVGLEDLYHFHMPDPFG